jgi:hypothetical protein
MKLLKVFARTAANGTEPPREQGYRGHDKIMTVPGCKSARTAVNCGTSGEISSILFDRVRRTVTVYRSRRILPGARFRHNV